MIAYEDNEYIQSRQSKRSFSLQLDGTSKSILKSSGVAENGIMSDYDDSEGEVNSDSSDDEGNIRRKTRKVTYDSPKVWKVSSNTTIGSLGKIIKPKHNKEASSSKDKLVELPTQESRT